ncbi:MAG: hypothetical protein H7146_03955, partial [Burkholderiaceae bacterium]|nr:hypothetical protein [Microbacteriaceae bacterium]
RLGAAARATYERTYSLDRFDREFGALWTRVERRSRRSSLWGPGVR